MSENQYFSVCMLNSHFSIKGNVFILTVKILPAHLKYLLEAYFKNRIVEFKTEWMTLPGSWKDKAGAACDPRDTMPSPMDTVPQPRGVVSAWMGARGRLLEEVTAWVCSRGPDSPQDFLTLQVLSEAYFVFYGGIPHSSPVSVDKCPYKFTQDF